MSVTRPQRLLQTSDPAPVELRPAAGDTPFIILIDHAGRAIPERLGRLGLHEADLARHIAWDIGAGATGRLLGEALDAPVVAQAYSRLVIDCNRRPGHPTSIAPVSDLTEIPGNRSLSAEDRTARENEIFHPYHRQIARLLDERAQHGQESVLVALHSFTPQLRGTTSRPSAGGTDRRPWHIGLLHNHDARLARILLRLLAEEPGLVVGDNEPYRLSEIDDYTAPHHGEGRGLAHIEIELRQDLIAEAEGQRLWAERLARLLRRAMPMLAEAPS